MKRMTCLLFLLLAACAPRVHDPDWQSRSTWGLKPMPEADLRRLLSGVEIGPHCCENADVYFADGGFVALRGQALSSRYLVKGNVVSILAVSGTPVEAHRFFTDATGRVFYTTRGRDGALPANPRPVEAGVHER